MTEAATALSRPRPAEDPDTGPYWVSLRAHRLLLQTCAACDRRRFPAMPSCPYCGEPSAQWKPCAGTGSIYSYVVVRRAFDPAFRDDTPYVVATVDLDGGARAIGRVAGPEPAIGDRVGPVFVDHDGWTELRFEALQAS
jgi:uncharacterized OB-fold protein